MLCSSQSTLESRGTPVTPHLSGYITLGTGNGSGVAVTPGTISVHNAVSAVSSGVIPTVAERPLCSAGGGGDDPNNPHGYPGH